MTRSINADEHLPDSLRTCVLLKRPDGSVGAHDLKTGRLLAIVDPQDVREDDDVDPMPGIGALCWGIACIAALVVAYVLVQVGIWIGRTHY